MLLQGGEMKFEIVQEELQIELQLIFNNYSVRKSCLNLYKT